MITPALIAIDLILAVVMGLLWYARQILRRRT